MITVQPSAASMRGPGIGDALTRPETPQVRVGFGDRPDVSIPFPPGHPAWVPGLVARIGELLAFPADWDGRGGRPATAEATLITLHVLSDLSVPGVPGPSAFLLPDGGLQLEWHTGGWDLEIEVRPNGDVDAWGGAVDGSAQVAADSVVDLWQVRDVLAGLHA